MLLTFGSLTPSFEVFLWLVLVKEKNVIQSLQQTHWYSEIQNKSRQTQKSHFINNKMIYRNLSIFWWNVIIQFDFVSFVAIRSLFIIFVEKNHVFSYTQIILLQAELGLAGMNIKFTTVSINLQAMDLPMAWRLVDPRGDNL